MEGGNSKLSLPSDQPKRFFSSTDMAPDDSKKRLHNSESKQAEWRARAENLAAQLKKFNTEKSDLAEELQSMHEYEAWRMVTHNMAHGQAVVYVYCTYSINY